MEELESPKTLVDQAYGVILDALCDGTFQAGERLTQEDIAARLRVSRQPVTHALAILRAQGFLTPSGRRGLTVTPVSSEFFDAIYEFRAVVEPLAVRLATPRLTKAAILKGRTLIETGRNLVMADDARGALHADMDFHSFIYEFSNNPVIADTMSLHWRHLQRAMGRVLRYPGMSIAVWLEHDRIFEKMASGDADEAAELMRQHLVGAHARVKLES